MYCLAVRNQIYWPFLITFDHVCLSSWLFLNFAPLILWMAVWSWCRRCPWLSVFCPSFFMPKQLLLDRPPVFMGHVQFVPNLRKVNHIQFFSNIRRQQWGQCLCHRHNCSVPNDIKWSLLYFFNLTCIHSFSGPWCNSHQHITQDCTNCRYMSVWNHCIIPPSTPCGPHPRTLLTPRPRKHTNWQTVHTELILMHSHFIQWT